MIKKLKKKIEQIRNIGVSSNHSLKMVEKIRILNSMALIGISINIFFLCLDLFVYHTSMRVVILIGLMSLILGGILIFNRFKKIQVTFYYIIISSTILFSYLKIFYVNNWGEQFMFLILISLVLLLFDNIRQQLFFVAGIVALFIIAQVIHYSINDETTLSMTSSRDSRLYMFIIYALMLGFIINLHKKWIVSESELQLGLLKELQEKYQEIQEVSKEVERFNHIASHDLKSPLRNIVSFLGLIKVKLKRNKLDEIPEQLKFAEDASKQMNLLIDDILAFSNISESNDKLSSFRVDDLMNEVVEDLKDFIKTNNAQIEFNSLPTLNTNYKGLKMVFQNLVKNGIQYNNSTHPIVKITYSNQNNHNVFDIQDNGIGISEEFQSQVFEYFKRLHTYESYRGTGLGLGISKKIIDKMNGRLTLESKVGQGSVFRVMLPVK